MDIDAFNSAVLAVEDAYDADIFLYNAPIGDEGFSNLANSVACRRPAGGRKNCMLILVTLGGLANSAYQIARLLQVSYDKFYLFAPSVCKSAGTIVALGAHELVMDVFSELGPLDVQLLDKDEIGSRKSGLLTRSAFEALAKESFDLFSHHMLNIKIASGGLVSFKLAAELSARMTSDLMAPVFSQLNPDVIGSDYRDLAVAMEYGERLAQRSDNLHSHAIQRLISGYPSHDFIIDRDEANTLFRHVKEPSAELYDLVGHIAQYTHRPSTTGIVTNIEEIKPDNDSDSVGDSDGQDSQEDGTPNEVDEGGSTDRKGNKAKGDKG